MNQLTAASPLVEARPVDFFVRAHCWVWPVAIAGALLAAAVLVGWWTDIPRLKSVAPGLSAMKANTALAFLLSFAAVYWLSTDSAAWRRLGKTCAAIALLIGVATLFQYATSIDLTIDELLFRDDPQAVQTPAPGRMGANTAFNFVLVSVALLCARSSMQRGIAYAQYLAAAVLALTLAVLLGYLFSATSLLGFRSFTPMALHTAGAFIALGLAILWLDVRSGFMGEIASDYQGGTVARRMLPVIIVVIPLAGWVRLQGEHAGYFETELGLALFALFNVLFLSTVTVAIATRLNRAGRIRRSVITAQEAAVAELRVSEQRFRDLVEGSIQAIVVHRHLKPIFANDAYARLVGLKNAEDVMKFDSLDWTMAPEDRDRINRYRVARERGEVPQTVIASEGRRRDGSTFWVYGVGREVNWDGNSATQVTLLDVTDFKKTEQQLRQAQKMEAVGQLTGGIAHDFNNILTVVSGSLDALLDEIGDDRPELSSLANHAQDAVFRGAALTQRLLAFSRQQVLQPAVIDLNQLVKGMDDLLRRSLGEAIEIETVLVAGLWRTVADKSQVENALLNLAVNARDAMADGGKLTIETANVRLDEAYAATNFEVKPGQYTMLAVTDIGMGMPPEILERAFDPFFTTKETGKGTGLGLSMVFGFAKQSGGHAKIYSEVGHGTTVRLYLPRAAADAVADPDNAREAVTGAGRGESILLVEDDQNVRTTTTTILTRLGYAVIAAGNGPEALAILDQGTHIDLLFTDVVMPRGMNGRQLADEAQRRRSGLKVLFTSGYAQNSVVHHGRLDEGVQMIGKPYRSAELGRKIREVLGK